jgi:uncharacterized protein YigA (DUF484 family)
MRKRRVRVSDDGSLTFDQVAEYLLSHRDFFEHRSDLLEKLQIPHPSGAAVSLVARQLEVLRKKNRALQDQLDSLVRIARENDRLAGKMHQLVLAVMEAETFDELIARLTNCLQQSFSVDWVGLRIVEDDRYTAGYSLMVSADHVRLQRFRKIIRGGAPKCGHIDIEQAEFLFGEGAQAVASCAIVPLPLLDQGGLLAIGSREKNRFHPGMGHLFLRQMGEIVGSRLCKLLMMAS